MKLIKSQNLLSEFPILMYALKLRVIKKYKWIKSFVSPEAWNLLKYWSFDLIPENEEKLS